MFLSQLKIGVISDIQLRLSKEDDDYHHDHGDNLLEQEAKPVVKKPPMYKVIMLNDDYTPMEFVVYALESFFGMGTEQATKPQETMERAHRTGKTPPHWGTPLRRQHRLTRRS